MNQPAADSPSPPPHSNRRSQLARIAAELFCERGYHGVGLGDIAAKAGITGPAIYRHFRNKKAILAYVNQDLITAITAARARAPETGSPWERIDALMCELAKLVVERRRSLQLYQWQHRYLESAEQETFGDTLASLIRILADLLGTARPRLPTEERTILVAAALSSLAGLSTHRTPVSAQVAEDRLRGIALGVLTTGLPPRLTTDPLAGNESGHVGEYVSRRERLIVSALRPIRERGFHTVTMEELGAAAGIGGSSVYRHFSSKADLLAAVYYRAADRIAVTTSMAVESAANPGEALRRLVDSYVHYAYQNSDLAAVYLSEYGNLPIRDRRALRKVQREHVEQWVRLVMAVREEHQSVDVRIAVHSALNMVHDFSMRNPRIVDVDQLKYLVFAALSS